MAPSYAAMYLTCEWRLIIILEERVPSFNEYNMFKSSYLYIDFIRDKTTFRVRRRSL